MADELKGKIYEILSIIAIKRYTSIIEEDERIFWNKQPSSINVEPDITIGHDVNMPRLLILVTHTAAERASDKKFWRNMGEFVDARLAFSDSLRIISVNFDSAQKRKLAFVSDLMFDGMIEVDRTDYGNRLIALANQLVEEYEPVKVSLEAKAALIEEQISLGRGSELLKLLANDLQSISRLESANSKGWFAAFSEVQRKRVFCRLPDRKCTYIRRGVGRLLPIDDENTVRSILSSIRENKTLSNVPDYFIKLGLATKSTVGYRITQRIPRGKAKSINELYYIKDTLSDDDIVRLWSAARSATTALRQICEEISADMYSSYNSFVVSNYSLLTNPVALAKAMEDCFNSPNMVLEQELPGIPDTSRAWLFDYIMTIIKASTGKQQGYGYSRLVVDSGLLVPGKRSVLDFALPQYNSRTKMLDSLVNNAVAAALSKRLSAIGVNWIQANESLIHSFYLRGLFEDKNIQSCVL